MTVIDFGFVGWNHSCFGSPWTSCRHHRNNTGTVVIMMPMMTMMIVLVMLVMGMLVMAAVVTTTVRQWLGGMAHRFRGHTAAATGHHAAAIVL